MDHKTPTETILDRWPNRQAIADDTGVDLFAVHRWFQRGSIPGKHDASLLSGAARRGLKLSAQELIEARSVHTDRNGHTSRFRQEVGQ